MTKYPRPCAHCERSLRPGGTTEADYPNTMEHQAKGLCAACYSTPHRKKPVTYPRPCKSCERSLRPAHTSSEQYPTTEAPHKALGLCSACYSAQYHNRNPNKTDISKRAMLAKLRHENTVAGLENFMARIRGKSRV